MTGNNWKVKTHSLFRGDKNGGVSTPVPSADRSIVRHILFLEGQGRETPYLSTSESPDVARRFASGFETKVYTSAPASWAAKGVKHRPRTELLGLLKGKGKGDAAWKKAYEVSKAAQYVEESLEHLADFSSRTDLDAVALQELTSKLFF